MPEVLTKLQADVVTDARARDAGGKLAFVIAITIALLALVIAHVDGINGASYHLWTWRWIAPWRIYPALLIAAAPFRIGQGLGQRGYSRSALLCLMLGMFCMQVIIVGMQVEPFDPWRIAETVQHPLATSYFTDGHYLATQRAFGKFLSEYPGLMSFFNLHSRQKPPGPILFYYASVKLIGDPHTAALVGGLILGAISTLGIPSVYLFVRQVSGDRQAAFAGASYFALCPSVVLFFPMIDIIYPALACAMLGFWVAALRSLEMRWAVLLGLALSLMLFMVFNLLILGPLMLAMAVVVRPGMRRFAIASCTAIGVVIAVYGVLYVVSGYNPVATFFAALRNQAVQEATFYYPHPYPQTIPSDIQDFLLGSGWISLLLVMFCLMRRPRPLVVLLGLGEIALVAASGVLRCETARTWAFLLPLMMLPIGIELSNWPRPARWGIYACLWLLVAAMAQNIKFMI